ncbi:hypothetical protein [Mycolicibacterium komossense]|uniref:Uncharacterized protein n=1 Tax=Mycolicibacterium komossense TaxID=1779 RepID=A0ABT3CMF0_9MYCO|nr:hypothetical protein [Mycolicibacterium komossense]MCV7230664.1 hypothetical protein [Mycolicibacterium komossense]
MTARKTTTTPPPAAEKEDQNDTVSRRPFSDQISRDDETGLTTITFRDNTFTFPTSRSEWPTRAMQIFQRGRAGTFPDGVELMIGTDQWDRFLDIAPKIGDFWEFFPIFTEAAGLVRQDAPSRSSSAISPASQPESNATESGGQTNFRSADPSRLAATESRYTPPDIQAGG